MKAALVNPPALPVHLSQSRCPAAAARKSGAFHGSYFHRLALYLAGDSDLLARQFVQFLFMASQRVDLVDDHQSVLGSAFYADTSTIRRAALLHVLGSAHRVTDRSRQALLLVMRGWLSRYNRREQNES